MTVAQLIDQLQDQPKDRPVLMVCTDNPQFEAIPVHGIAVKCCRKRGYTYKLTTGSANAVVINGDL